MIVKNSEAIVLLVLILLFLLGGYYFFSIEPLKNDDLIKLANMSDCHLVEIKDRLTTGPILQSMVSNIHESCPVESRNSYHHASQLKAIKAL